MRPSVLPRWAVVGLVVALACGAARLTAAATDDVVGPDTWERVRGLVPDEFLESYRRGDYRHRIAEYNLDPMADEPVFRAALEANKDRYDLTDDGTVIEKAPGTPPDYVYGWPFPTIDPADPKAAMKIVWNYYYTLYYGGNAHYRADLIWLNRSGIDRTVAVDAKTKHYDGQHPRFREPANPLGLLTQTMANVLSPEYYRFGKLILRFDKDTFMGSYASKYDWNGSLISSFTAINSNIVKAAPGELWAWAGGAVAVAIDWKRDRATTAGIAAGKAVPADSRLPLSPEDFSLQQVNAGR